MVTDIIQIDWRILIQPFYHFRSSYPTVYYCLPLLLITVEYIQGNEERTKDSEEYEEIVNSQLPPFYSSHHWIFFELSHFIPPKHLRLFYHFEMFFSRRFDGVLQHFFSNTHFHVEKSDPVESTPL